MLYRTCLGVRDVKNCFFLPGTGLFGGVKVVLELSNYLAKLPFIKTYIIAPDKKPNWLYENNFDFINTNIKQIDYSYFDVGITTFCTQKEVFYRWNHQKVLFHLCQGFEADYTEDLNTTYLNPEIYSFYQLPYPKLTINEFLKQKLCSIGCKKVYNIGQGINQKIFYPKKIQPKDNILIVGSFEYPFKGIKQSLNIARIIKEKFNFIKIIRISTTNTYNLEKELAPIDQFYTQVTPQKMGDFYRNALLSIYLPTKEGFGLPVLESIACGTPVIGSNIPSIREICGPQYPLCSPQKISEAIDLASQLIEKKSFYNNLKQIGIKQAKRFSYWKMSICFLKYLFIQKAFKTHK